MPSNRELRDRVEAVMAELRADSALVEEMFPAPTSLAAATARAERAEAANTEGRFQLLAELGLATDNGSSLDWLIAAMVQERNDARAAIERVRAALDEARGVVARFRAGHNPECECEWDRGAMSVVESVAAALDSSETPPAAPEEPTAARSAWQDCPVCGQWPCDEHYPDAPPAAPVPEERGEEKPKKWPPTGYLCLLRGNDCPGHPSKWMVCEEKPHCPTCGPTTLERHPRLPVMRCSNCKEHLRSDSALPVDGETT